MFDYTYFNTYSNIQLFYTLFQNAAITNKFDSKNLQCRLVGSYNNSASTVSIKNDKSCLDS